jgi:hypothetical protein
MSAGKVCRRTRIWGTVLDRVNSVNSVNIVGRPISPRGLVGEPTCSRLAPFTTSAEFLRFLIRMLRNKVPNMEYQTKRSPDDHADSSLNSASWTLGLPVAQLWSNAACLEIR